MREYWANVYPEKSPYLGRKCVSRREADRMRRPGAICCIHVRLKHEGAPDRYASEANRRAWEWVPDKAREHARRLERLSMGTEGMLWYD